MTQAAAERACMGCVASAVQGTVTRSCRAYARSTRSGSRPSSASRLSSRLASTRLPPDRDTRRSLARSPAALLMKRCSSLRSSRVWLSVLALHWVSGRQRSGLHFGPSAQHVQDYKHSTPP